MPGAGFTWTPLCRMCVWQCELINQSMVCPAITPDTHTVILFPPHYYCHRCIQSSAAFVSFTFQTLIVNKPSEDVYAWPRARINNYTHHRNTLVCIQSFTCTLHWHSWCLCAMRLEEREVTNVQYAANGSSISIQCVVCCTQCNVTCICEHHGTHSTISLSLTVCVFICHLCFSAFYSCLKSVCHSPGFTCHHILQQRLIKI